MRRLRTFLSFALLGLAFFSAGAWVASYFWWPQVGFPWPTSGMDQTHDYGFAQLTNGRILLARQRVILVPRGSDRIPGSTVIIGNSTRDAGSPLILLDRIDSGPPSGTKLYYAADSRSLGSLDIRAISADQARGGGRATMTTTTALSPGAISWRRLGFGHRQVAMPRIRIKDADVSFPRTTTAIPVWPLLLLALPAVLMLYRNRRSVRWAREGKCAGCGYDLRGSPLRCPECGRPARCATCGYDLRESPLGCPECGTPVPQRNATVGAGS